MAQDSDLSKSPDMGKGKAVDSGRKAEAQKDKPVANGKKGDEKSECLYPSLSPPVAVTPTLLALTAN
jgi:hypothetical protein